MSQFQDDILEGFEHLDDQVNHPSHYRAGRIECIDYIEDFSPVLNTSATSGAPLRNISTAGPTKWAARFRKAAWYLERLIKAVKENNNGSV